MGRDRRGRALRRRLDRGRRFLPSLARAGVRGATAEARALAGVLRALESAVELPSMLDAKIAIPPVRTAWVRRIPGFNLWLAYDIRPDGSVLVLFVLRTPPVPIE